MEHEGGGGGGGDEGGALRRGAATGARADRVSKRGGADGGAITVARQVGRAHASQGVVGEKDTCKVEMGTL